MQEHPQGEILPAAVGRFPRAYHDAIDVGVIAVVDRRRSARSRRAMQTIATTAITGWIAPGAKIETNAPAEIDDQRHDVRLEQQPEVTDIRDIRDIIAGDGLIDFSLMTVEPDSGLFDLRQIVEGMERRRRGDGPLQRIRTLAPGIVLTFFTGRKGSIHYVDEEHGTGR